MTTRAVICGGSGGEAWLALRAWRAFGRFPDVAVYVDDPELCRQRAVALGVEAVCDRAALFDDPTVQALHVLGGLHQRTWLLSSALDLGRPVLAAPPVFGGPRDLEILACAGPGLLRDAAVAPWLPALREGLRRVHANHIGRLQQVRFRSIVAGTGGWDPGLQPDCPQREPPLELAFEDALRRELARVLPIAEAVLGPVVEIHVQAPRREPPCTSLVTWRHREHACHGVLELSLLPHLTIVSPVEPREDSLEITGTAGILWVGRLRGGPGAVPPLRLYRGDTLLEPEPPVGGWAGAWAAMVPGAPALTIPALQHRLACLDAATASLATGERRTIL